MKSLKDWKQAYLHLPGGIQLALWTIVILWAGWFAVGVGGDGVEAKAQLGDHFGSLNALFTGLTCLGLAYTIYQQWQLNERLERDRNADVVEERFFQLMSGLRSLAASLSITIPVQDTNNGLTVFRTVSGKAMFEQIAATIQLGDLEGPTYTVEEIDRCQQNLFSRFGNYLAPFCATAKYILSYLDRNAGVRGADYVNLFVAEFSPAEIMILSIWPLGKKDYALQDLLNRHHVLRFMPNTTSFGFSRSRIKGFYPGHRFEWEQ